MTRSPSPRRIDRTNTTTPHTTAGTVAPSRPPIPCPASRAIAKTSATRTIAATGTGPSVQSWLNEPTTPKTAPSRASAA